MQNDPSSSLAAAFSPSPKSSSKLDTINVLPKSVHSPKHSESSPPTRKSPPPPKINLDDCKPFFPTSVTNTSANSSVNPSTAFVFTSSRTVRPPVTAQVSSSPPPISSVFTSPTTSPSSAPSSPDSSARTAHATHSSRPSLSNSQLAKHSQGAVDARCIVGPNMRAAGFVPLAHNLSPLSHSQHASISAYSRDGHSSTPSTGGVPTPNDPPPFPPIMFVSPARTPMWEYQRELGWGGSGRQNMTLGSAGSRSVALSSHPSVVAYPLHSQHSSLSSSPSIRPSSAISSLPSSSSSSSNLFSFSSSGSISMSTSFSSVPSMKSLAESDLATAHGIKDVSSDIYRFRPRTPPSVDGYPFPHTPPQRGSSSNSSSPPQSALSATSDTIASELGSISTANTSAAICVGSVDKPYPSATASILSKSSSASSRASHSRSSTIPATASTSRPAVRSVQTLPKPPSFRQTAVPTEVKRRTHTNSAELSLTELCDNSPRAWTTDPDCLGRMSSAPSSDSASSASIHGEGRSGRSRTYTADDLRGRKQKEKRLDSEKKEIAKVQKANIPAGPATHRMTPVHEEAVPRVDVDKKEDNLYAGLNRVEAETETTGLKERHHTMPTPGEESAKGKEREKPLSPRAQYGYSSFSFPPNTRRNSKSTPHVLGNRDPDVDTLGSSEAHIHRDKSAFVQDSWEREREHHREKMSRGLGALVQLHRDRDREQARQSHREHWKDREFDPESDKVKAGKNDEVDVVRELEKDWEKSQKLQRKRSHKERGCGGSPKTKDIELPAI